MIIFFLVLTVDNDTRTSKRGSVGLRLDIVREALPFVYHSYSIKLAIVKFHVPGFHYSSLDVRMIHPSIMGNSFLILVSFQFSCFFRLVNKQNRSHILCFDSENKNFRIANELTFGYSKDCVQLFRILKTF